MRPINYGRVLLGTLVGGLVANVCDYVTNAIIMADDARRMVSRLNLDPSVVASMPVTISWVVIDFIYAFLIVWTYAAIRPRLGPGPTTAAVAGLVIVGAVTVVLFGFMQMGVFTPDAFIKNAGLSMVTALLTAWAGAYLYQE